MGNGTQLRRGTANSSFAPKHPGHGIAFGAKADLRIGDLTVGLAGDSTGDETAEWFSRGFDMWLSSHPWVSAQYSIWADAYPPYTTTTKQTTNVAAATVWSDAFNRTASDLYGSSPDTGPTAWTGGGNAPSSWALNGTKAVCLATSQGIMQAPHGVTGDTTVTATGITIDSSTQKGAQFLLYPKYISPTAAIWGFLAISSSGVSSFGIWKTVNGSNAMMAFGTGAPIPASTSTTFNASISVVGTAVTFTVNGNTVTAQLTGTEAQILASATSGGFQVYGAGMAGMTVDSFAVSAQSGMQNLRLYNGSKAGSRLDYQLPRLKNMFPEPIDLLFISSSHNYGYDTAAVYLKKVQQFIENFRTSHPETSIVLVSQNPEFPASLTHEMHNERIAALRRLASEHGYGYLPAAEEFLSLPDRGVSLTRTDGVHPLGQLEVADPNNGSYLWATVAKRFLDSLSSPPLTGPFGYTYTIDPGVIRASDSLAVNAQTIYMRVLHPGFVTKIGLEIATQSGNICVAAYRNNGVGRAAVPGQRLATSGSVACPAAGYAEISLSTPVQVQAGDWLSISCDNATATFRSALAANSNSSLALGRQFSQTVFPAPATPASLTAMIGNTIVLLGV